MSVRLLRPGSPHIVDGHAELVNDSLSRNGDVTPAEVLMSFAAAASGDVLTRVSMPMTYNADVNGWSLQLTQLGGIQVRRNYPLLGFQIRIPTPINRGITGSIGGEVYVVDTYNARFANKQPVSVGPPTFNANLGPVMRQRWRSARAEHALVFGSLVCGHFGHTSVPIPWHAGSSWGSVSGGTKAFGDWRVGVNYEEGDWITKESGAPGTYDMYRCLRGHSSSDSIEPGTPSAATYWVSDAQGEFVLSSTDAVVVYPDTPLSGVPRTYSGDPAPVCTFIHLGTPDLLQPFTDDIERWLEGGTS